MRLDPLGLKPSLMTEDDWDNLRSEAEHIFTPGTAVKEQELFAGRSDQIKKLGQRIRLAGSHAVIFGERGVGKSSLVNVFRYVADKSPHRVQYIRIAVTTGDKYSDIILKIFKRMTIQYGDDEATILADSYRDRKITPDDVLLEFENFSEAATPIIVIDEFDRLSDSESKILVSDTIKLLSDEGANATFFIVGISDSVGDLLRGHESIGRSIAEVEMPRMSDEEIQSVIKDRLDRVGFKITEDALWRAVFICKGLPHYAHLLGLHSMQSACSRKSAIVETQDIEEATKTSLGEANQSIKESYSVATYSEKSNNIYKEVLASCALARKDEMGRFSAKNVAKRLSAITQDDYDVPAFSYHLNQFCEGSRGGLLEKMGKTRQFRFRFVEALMEPYVILESLDRGIITDEHIRQFSPKRQSDLFSI